MHSKHVETCKCFVIHILMYLCNKEYKDTFSNPALMDEN